MCRNPELTHPFGIHSDDNDNIIVQCEGVTNFKVWSKSDELLLDVDMESGDAIWIPMYYPHLATSKTKRLSVSFPINTEQPHEDRKWVKI